MRIRLAEITDLPQIAAYDQHIGIDELRLSILRGGVYVAKQEDGLMGWLRYQLFWDSIPFVNMVFVLEPHRNSGCGSALLACFEADMKAGGYGTVLTSTVSCETAQHFYYRRGYQAIGGFTLTKEPYEIILEKIL